MNELIDFWRQLNIEEKPLLHKNDNIKKDDYFDCKDYSDYIKLMKSPKFKSDNKFHLGLIPIPYIGDIENAKICILMLNPGFGICDYYAESNNEAYKKSLVNNLRQVLDKEYPFIFLNPEFLWHGGGQYWEKKLKNIIEETKILFKYSYADALSHVAKTVAVLQLVPYHSKSYLDIEPESSKIMRNFVENELLSKSEKCIICPRGNNYWKLKDNDNIILSPDKKSRAGHISKNTFGEDKWKKIIDLLL